MSNTKFDSKLVFGEVKKFSKGRSEGSGDSPLVGLEDICDRLSSDLHLIFNSNVAHRWSKKHYDTIINSMALVDNLVPLIIFDGDVGTGKSALAEKIGQVIADKYGYEIQLLKMSTQVRGKGFVGEMGTLLSESFQFVNAQATKTNIPTLLVIDEADSILTSRSGSGQHHEDKVAVNTILQHLDGFKKHAIGIAVIAITNRFDALDPAVKRRATANFTFSRPGKTEREKLFKTYLSDTGLSQKEISSLAEITKAKEVNGVATDYSYADLTLRVILPSLREAIKADRKITFMDISSQIDSVLPSPRMESH